MDPRTNTCNLGNATFTEWFEKFLCASINNALESLKPGGYLVLNLSDYKRKGKRQEICDKLNSFLESLKHLSYIGCVGMPLQVRYGRKQALRRTRFAEPIWIWKKRQEEKIK